MHDNAVAAKFLRQVEKSVNLTSLKVQVRVI